MRDRVEERVVMRVLAATATQPTKKRNRNRELLLLLLPLLQPQALRRWMQ
jgi:hypothetical protein